TIAWAAGLLEGEGSFGMSGRSIAIGIRMSDRDVIDRIGAILGGYTSGPINPHRPSHYRAMWRAQIKRPTAPGSMMTLYPFLGERRRAQIKRSLTVWRLMRYVRTSPTTCRAIVHAWDAGCRSKSHLARAFAVSRDTVYRTLAESGRITAVCEPRAEIDLDIAWMAGLFEGEGTVAINGRSLTIRIAYDRSRCSRSGGGYHACEDVRSTTRSHTLEEDV